MLLCAVLLLTVGSTAASAKRCPGMVNLTPNDAVSGHVAEEIRARKVTCRRARRLLARAWPRIGEPAGGDGWRWRWRASETFYGLVGRHGHARIRARVAIG
ncbi:MAG TPA: hypothetical protein VF533_04190 [Solirubrobacteraceae bacterium]